MLARCPCSALCSLGVYLSNAGFKRREKAEQTGWLCISHSSEGDGEAKGGGREHIQSPTQKDVVLRPWGAGGAVGMWLL